MMRTCTFTMTLLGLSVGGGATAFGQDISAAPTIGTAFDRNRTIAVADMIVPGYEPLGMKMGQLNVLPEVSFGTLAADNLYAQESDRKADIAVIVSPAVSILSQTTRNYLKLQGRATRTWFMDHGTESNSLYQASLQERYSLSPALTGYVYGGFRQSLVPRTDPGSIVGLSRPLIISSPSGGGQLTWTKNRVRVEVEGSYFRARFSKLYYNSGLVASPLGLNRHQGDVKLTAEYALSPNVALLAQARVARINYEDVAYSDLLDKSSTKREFLAGSSFELTDFIRGEVAVGYISQTYTSPIYRNFSGLGGRARVQFFPTRLTTVQVDVSRTVQEVASVLDSSYIATAASIKIDHALFRNVILTPSVSYSNNRFAQVGRKDNQARLNFNAVWMLDRNFSAQGQYQFVHSSTTATSLGRNFNVSQLLLTLSYKY